MKILYVILFIVFIVPFCHSKCTESPSKKCVSIGGDCGQLNTICQGGSYCNETSHLCQEIEKCVVSSDIKNDTCSQAGYICSNGYCLRSVSPPGSKCKTNENCDTLNNILCTDNICSNSQACNNDMQCLQNQYCNFPIIPFGICTARIPLGGSCSAPNSCGVGLICVNSKCSEVFSGKVGESCFPSSVPNNIPCDIGLTCKNTSTNIYKCVESVPNSQCNISNVNDPFCDPHSSCICGTEIGLGDNEICATNYNSTNQCKQSIISLNQCGRLFFVPPTYDNYLTQIVCKKQLCDYKRDCLNDYNLKSSCGNEGFKYCPSDYEIIPSSSDSSSSSSSNSSSSSTNSDSSSSSSSANSSSSSSANSDSSSSANSDSSTSEVSSSMSTTTSNPSSDGESEDSSISSSTVLLLSKFGLFVLILLVWM